MIFNIITMATLRLEEMYKFQPLKNYLLLAEKEGWKGTRLQKNLLLSRIKNIDRNIVERLERAGVYDSDEFIAVKDEIIDYLGISEQSMKTFVSIVEKEINKVDKRPIIDLEMKDKFCFVTTVSDEESNTLALISDEILFMWSNPLESGWAQVKYAFDKTFELLERPELLSCLNNDDNIPSWLQLEEITTYIGSLDPMIDVYTQAEELGFPIMLNAGSAIELAEIKALKLKFVHEIASRYRMKKNELIGGK